MLCSLFPLLIFFGLWVSGAFDLGLARYDFMLLWCLAMQAVLVWTRLETVAELKVICVFHLVGLCLELYKVSHGSWRYPEPALTKVAGVPVFSGFMYASVASYMVQAWRRFELSFERFPRWPWIALVGAAIYANFFLSRTFGDSRWWIAAGVFAVFARTRVGFTALSLATSTPGPSSSGAGGGEGLRRRMPLILAFFLIGVFVWLAENLCTYLGAWEYPNQRSGWEMVDLGKLSSWCLLVIVSFILVAGLKKVGTQVGLDCDGMQHDPDPASAGLDKSPPEIDP